MAIDNLATFNSTFALLSLVFDGSWTTTLSDWLDARVTAKASVNGVTHATPPFTFNKSVFKTQLDNLILTDSQSIGATQMALAWRTAIDNSTLVTVAGDFINPGGPTNTWSVVNNSILDTVSKSAAQTQLQIDLSSIGLVFDITNSLFPKALRDAFLSLTCSIDGLDVAGPNPLSISGAALL